MICLFFWVREFVCLLVCHFSPFVCILLIILNEAITPLFFKREVNEVEGCSFLASRGEQFVSFVSCSCPFIYLCCNFFCVSSWYKACLHQLNFSSPFQPFFTLQQPPFGVLLHLIGEIASIFIWNYMYGKDKKSNRYASLK